jgi:phenylpyruvate tautomerase
LNKGSEQPLQERNSHAVFQYRNQPDHRPGIQPGVYEKDFGMPESYVLISLKPGTSLIFGGSDKPAAFVRLKSIGLPKDRCSELSAKICGYITEELGVPKDRVFIDFKDLERNLFGWNGKTF